MAKVPLLSSLSLLKFQWSGSMQTMPMDRHSSTWIAFVLTVVATHRRTFGLRQAGYTPMVSDGRRLYLIGYYELIGLRPARR